MASFMMLVATSPNIAKGEIFMEREESHAQLGEGASEWSDIKDSLIILEDNSEGQESSSPEENSEIKKPL